MVFPSSVPLYLDPPTWNQQPIDQSQQQQNQPPRPDGAAAGSAPPRPNSMAERARLAKIPQPEPALKCPRCDSTNTKFCYFNNYSLSQPRHFCKACRRYWTRGGALRNVPVGGGCRRNKRSSASSSSSKSKPSTSAGAAATSAPMPPPPQMPFLHPAVMDYNATSLSFHGMQQQMDQYQLGVGQIHQFPFLGEPPQTMYPFDGTESAKSSTEVKMEESSRGLNMARQFLGLQRTDNNQFWGGGSGSGNGGGGSSGGGGWMSDLSGFNSSSAGNLL